ncbi:MAG: hypothetical protein AAFY42_05310 [Pseudomonadota bacterium]
MSEKVLITGARAPASLDLARAFRLGGYGVQLADSVPAYAAKLSEFRPIMRLPKPRFDFTAFAQLLDEFCIDNPEAVILPTCEEVFFVSAAAQKHGFGAQVLTSDLNTLRKLHSKIEFPSLLQSLGLPTPQTRILDGPIDHTECRDVVLKPEFSRFGSATIIRPDRRAMRRIIPSPMHRWACQEYIAGEEHCLWSMAREGSIVASVVYRPKWRHGRTAAYAFEAVEAPGALTIASRLAKSLGYTGQLALDLIRTADGEFVPIECNPRAVSGVHLFDGKASLAKAIMGDGPAVEVTTGLRYLAPAMWLMGLPKSLVEGRFREWRGDMSAGRDALGHGEGFAPIAGALLDAARFAALGLTRLRSPAGQTTDDIEWNGEAIA